MADFTSGFWDYYIAAITLLGIIGCGILLWAQSKARVGKRSDINVDTTGHIWDQDLTELNTPMPRWWMWLFYITIVFALVYLVLYPGLGSYAGKLGWSSNGNYQTELKQAEAEYGPLFAQYQQQDLKTVAADPKARAIGERLFLTYCAQCHGSDARGNKGFPNLTDKDWLFGGTPEIIKQTILHGRTGVMPPMGAAVGSEKDIETAVAKEMIKIIRKEKPGDFEWESRRLGRTVKMSARKEDEAELQAFLLKEMFPEYRP